jgi:hypothetical protein
MVAYEPVRSPVQIDASAAVDAVDTLTPEMRAVWKSYIGNSDKNIANYLSGAGQTIRNDLATSGLFARVVTNDSQRPDYIVQALCLESHPSDFRVSVTLTATESATGTQVSSHTREHSFGTSAFAVKWKDVLPGLMAGLKADLVADLQEKARHKQELADQEDAELLNKTSLSELLVSSDKSVTLARARNRAIVAAKNHQLPTIIRERKTEELTELVVKIEQTILDLNHECEVAKDQAQQSVADGSSENARQSRGGRGDASQTTAPTQLEETRGLAICYRERIELLKPILAALKEEIANRSR